MNNLESQLKAAEEEVDMLEDVLREARREVERIQDEIDDDERLQKTVTCMPAMKEWAEKRDLFVVQTMIPRREDPPEFEPDDAVEPMPAMRDWARKRGLKVE